MKTKSVRARIEDAEKIEQSSRVLSAKLQKRITVSMLINEMMECLKDAEKRIEKKNGETS